MKKILVMLLAVAMVASLCAMMFVSAENPNLAAGKEVANAAVNGVNGGYNANLTDGVAAGEISYDGNWFAFYYHADKTNEENQAAGANSVDGVASPTIDLGAVYALGQVRINTFLGNGSGIGSPSAISVEVSTDGETYTKLDEKTFDLPAADGDDKAKVAWVEFDVDVEAQYVRINLTHTITWVFVNEIEVYGAAGEDAPATSEPADEPDDEPAGETQTYEDYTVGEDGNATAPVCYGYTWNVNYIDGVIAGEDVTIVTSLEKYAECNAKWAITAILEKQADGTYVAAADAIAGAGETPAIELGENQIALVVHSSSSKPADAGSYANWIGKVAAKAIKTGDVFTVTEKDGAIASVYAVIPGESTEAPETSKPETSKPQTGDEGILVFAVLGVVAICGAAVTIKSRG